MEEYSIIIIEYSSINYGVFFYDLWRYYGNIALQNCALKVDNYGLKI